jgi:uncharacterized NAD(P)/FAD-binding protein YdhS
MATRSADASITQWIADLKDGREPAAQWLWKLYFDRLARTKFAAATRRLRPQHRSRLRSCSRTLRSDRPDKPVFSLLALCT